MPEIVTLKDGTQECRSCELYPPCWAYAARPADMQAHTERHLALDALRAMFAGWPGMRTVSPPPGFGLPSRKLTEGNT